MDTRIYRSMAWNIPRQKSTNSKLGGNDTGMTAGLCAKAEVKVLLYKFLVFLTDWLQLQYLVP